MGNLMRSAVLALVLAASGRASADSPVEQVDATTFCSKNQKYCAQSTRDPSLTSVYAETNPGQVLWSRKEFVVKGYVSDDGQAVASCYAGLNLLPLDAKADFLVARIFHASGRAKEIRIGAVYPDIRVLPRTDSHVEWGRCIDIDEDGLIIERVDGTQWKSKSLR